MGGITNVTSQSTIKMDKGYYYPNVTAENIQKWSQSTIKMDKGYYETSFSRSRSQYYGRNPQ